MSIDPDNKLRNLHVATGCIKAVL